MLYEDYIAPTIQKTDIGKSAMTFKEQAVDSLIRSTAALGRLTGHILKERPANSRGGISKSKASRKAERRARRTTRRG